jgi:hypothetical protein
VWLWAPTASRPLVLVGTNSNYKSPSAHRKTDIEGNENI